MHHFNHWTRREHVEASLNTLPFRYDKHEECSLLRGFFAEKVDTSEDDSYGRYRHKPIDYRDERSDRFPDFIETFEMPGGGALEVLQQKGVFEIPPAELQRMVLDKYEEFLHPLLPFLNVVQVRRTITGQDTNTKISLFLYHAVMFIGLSCVDDGTISRLARVSKQAARAASYEKAKTLFEMDIERDRAAICRGSILLTGHPYQLDPKDATYWLGVAISQAYNMKLYRVQTNHFETREYNSERILWWCVLMKECEVAMAMDHPPRIWPFNSPMLAMSDFGLDDEGQFQTEEGKVALAFILKAKLYSRIYQIMRNIYEEIQPWNIKGGDEMLPELRQHMVEHLQSWTSEVPPELRYEKRPVNKTSFSDLNVAWSMTISKVTFWAAHFIVYMDNLQH
ncbi:hypothetical protein BDV19DRAFT_251000 [Aspergillus venezuelensis]